MTKKEFVTYEQAVKLKELGFNWKCNQFYWNKNLSRIDTQAQVNRNINGWGRDNKFSAPTLSQVAKWLREEKGLFICVWLCAAGYGWEIEKCGENDGKGTHVAKHDEISGDDENSGLFTTYEKALLSGIDKALEIIK